MFDAQIRKAIGPTLGKGALLIAKTGVSPNVLTGLGWILGIGSALAVSTHEWYLALALWLGNRLFDGLDGSLARLGGQTDLGGFLDIVADFSVYGAFILGVAVAEPKVRLVCVLLFFTYYVSGTAFLALSSLLEKRRQTSGDERSLIFVGGLAEGAETTVAYVGICLFPSVSALIVSVFALAVGITAVQRVLMGAKMLRSFRELEVTEKVQSSHTQIQGNSVQIGQDSLSPLEIL